MENTAGCSTESSPSRRKLNLVHVGRIELGLDERKTAEEPLRRTPRICKEAIFILRKGSVLPTCELGLRSGRLY